MIGYKEDMILEDLETIKVYERLIEKRQKHLETLCGGKEYVEEEVKKALDDRKENLCILYEFFYKYKGGKWCIKEK